MCTAVQRKAIISVHFCAKETTAVMCSVCSGNDVRTVCNRNDRVHVERTLRSLRRYISSFILTSSFLINLNRLDTDKVVSYVLWSSVFRLVCSEQEPRDILRCTYKYNANAIMYRHRMLPTKYGRTDRIMEKYRPNRCLARLHLANKPMYNPFKS